MTFTLQDEMDFYAWETRAGDSLRRSQARRERKWRRRDDFAFVLAGLTFGVPIAAWLVQ